MHLRKKFFCLVNLLEPTICTNINKVAIGYQTNIKIKAVSLIKINVSLKKNVKNVTLTTLPITLIILIYCTLYCILFFHSDVNFNSFIVNLF